MASVSGGSRILFSLFLNHLFQLANEYIQGGLNRKGGVVFLDEAPKFGSCVRHFNRRRSRCVSEGWWCWDHARCMIAPLLSNLTPMTCTGPTGLWNFTRGSDDETEFLTKPTTRVQAGRAWEQTRPHFIGHLQRAGSNPDPPSIVPQPFPLSYLHQ